MNVIVVGLGLMGGAYASRLTKANHKVYGVDINENSIKYAKDNGYIIDGSLNILDFLDKADLLILSIYPQAILDFLKEYSKYFKSNLIVTDICGVKASFVYEATKLAHPAIYCSTHPMAGREKIGVEYSKYVVFEGANYLVVPTTMVPQKVIDIMLNIGKDLSFSRFTVISPEKHDDMIGFTSQLCHAIAVSLVNSDHNPDTKSFIGDSYRDLTRIAMINENLWSELFLENKEYLLKHINSFEYELDRLKKSLENDDIDSLKEIFRESTLTRRKMEK